jgi:hypothetical protein
VRIDGEHPIWEDGDVVRIAFKRKKTDDLSAEYTYIRSDGYWPGEAEWSSHTDYEMTEAWHQARLAHAVMVQAPVPALASSDLPHHYVLSERYAKGTYGAWCYACSDEAQDYVYPCNKPDRFVPPHTLVAKE